MRNNKEYELCKAIATYLHLQYPTIIYHFDYAGLNLSKAQAGRMKVIQGQRGFPDLFIAEPRGEYHGLFIELKAEGTRFLNKNNVYATPHIIEQSVTLDKLNDKDYYSVFCIGFDDTKIVIDSYLNP